MPALSIDGPFRLSAELPRVLWALDAVAPAQQRKAVPSAIIQAFNQHVDKRLAVRWQRAEAAASLLREDGSARMIVARIIDLFGHDAQLPKWGAGLRHISFAQPLKCYADTRCGLSQDEGLALFEIDSKTDCIATSEEHCRWRKSRVLPARQMSIY